MKKVREELQRRTEMEAALNEEQSRQMRELPYYGMF